MKLEKKIKKMSLVELQKTVQSLWKQIRKVRDASNNQKCWAEWARLYLMLPEKKLPKGMQLSLDPQVLLGNCKGYWSRECGMNTIIKLMETVRSKQKPTTKKGGRK